MGLLDFEPTPRPMGGLLGALSQQNQLGGLLGAGFKPGPDENLMTRIFGTNDPRDPRSAAMMGLATGLMRGGLPEGLERFQRGWDNTEDRAARRLLGNLQLSKGAMELSEAQRKLREETEGRDVLRNFYANLYARRGQGVPGQGSPNPALRGAGLLPPTAASGTDPAQSAAGGDAAPLMQPPLGGASARNFSGASAFFDRYQELADAYDSKGLYRQGQAAREFALKFKPKFNTAPQVVKDPATGQLVNVLIGEDGTTQQMSYGVKPNIRMENLGGTTQAIDENNLRGGETFNRTMTPGEVASNQVALGNLRVSQGQLGLARDRFNAEQSAPQYMQLDGGIYELPKRPQGGLPAIARAVTLPNGEPVGGNNPKLTEFQGKSTTFGTRMRDATGVLDKLEGQAWPSTVNRAGYQAEMPNWLPGGSLLAAAATGLNNMTVPTKAQQLHQAQENWVTANLRQESGAAIGKEEMQREKIKWFPQPGDGADLIRQKAEARRVAEEAMMTQAGPGSRLIQGSLDRAAQVNQQRRNAATVAQPLPSNPTAQSLQRGQVYKLPNGAAARWDGFRFVGE